MEIEKIDDSADTQTIQYISQGSANNAADPYNFIDILRLKKPPKQDADDGKRYSSKDQWLIRREKAEAHAGVEPQAQIEERQYWHDSGRIAESIQNQLFRKLIRGERDSDKGQSKQKRAWR